MTPSPLRRTCGERYLRLLLLLLAASLLFASAVRASLVPSGDGTATDTDTGLMWTRCTMGQTWTGFACMGSATAYTWAQAAALTSTLAGHGDWRLPTVRELESIVDRSRYNPAIDPVAFPATGGVPYWSSTPIANAATSANTVNFLGGANGSAAKTLANYVRLVRGSQASARMGITRPTSDYALNGDGTVTHVPTGLVWQRCPKGQAWTGATCSGTAALYLWSEAMVLDDRYAGYTDWRLPSIEELLSLADYTKASPALNSTAFPNTTPGFYWSATNQIANTTYAWGVNFSLGAASDASKTIYKNFIWLVRAGTARGPFTLSVVKSGSGAGVVASVPDGIQCGATCLNSFAKDTGVTLTASPTAGHIFTGWSGDCSGTGATCTVAMTSERSVQAKFHTPNYGGLWWKSPAGSESGWGINLAHQGNAIFATWFTYDASRKPWWLIAELHKGNGNVFSGTVSTVTGSPFDAVPFDMSKVKETEVGTMTITFASNSQATLSYTVNGVSQSKAITPQVFGPLPTCYWNDQPDMALAANYQDLWWSAPPGSESGWGINFTHQGNVIFATWFTYDAQGQPWWLIAELHKGDGNVFSGPVSTVAGPPFDAVPFDPAKVTETQVGTATVTFGNGNAAEFAYTVNGSAQTKSITRQIWEPPGTACN
jgi:uncharacterized repeat protein (TIGR02543 family)